MATFTVNFGEMEGYPQSKWSRGEFRATRRLICDWTDRVTLLTELDTFPGNVYPYGEAPYYETGGTQYGLGFAYAVEIDPFPAKETEDPGRSVLGDSVALYDQAVLTVHYSNLGPRWYSDGTKLVTERFDPITKYESVDKSELEWHTDNAPLERDLPWSRR